jgi:hypothetical protein
LLKRLFLRNLKKSKFSSSIASKDKLEGREEVIVQERDLKLNKAIEQRKNRRRRFYEQQFVN